MGLIMNMYNEIILMILAKFKDTQTSGLGKLWLYIRQVGVGFGCKLTQKMNTILL